MSAASAPLASVDSGPARLAEIVGPLERSTGEGADARGLLLVLDAAGYGFGAEGLGVHHGPPPRLVRARAARVNVARTTWYTDRLPAGWWRACAAFDEMWVPSQTARGAFEAGGVAADRLRVVPSAVDTNVFTPDGEPLELEGRRGFTFLSIFDWTPRKGWDILVDAYLAEFSAAEDVVLVLKVMPTTTVGLEQVAEQLQARIDAARGPGAETAGLAMVWEEMPESALAALYRAADCFVLPTRGEGYGRAVLEAQACGVAVIATATGAAGECQPPDSPLRLRATAGEVTAAAAFELPALTAQRWADPDPAALRMLMRSAFEDRERTARLGGEARSWVAEHRNPGHIARALRDMRAAPRLPPRSAHPMVHVVIPVSSDTPGDGDHADLRGTLESIARQTYRDVALTITAGEDIPARVRALAEEYGAELVLHRAASPTAAGAAWKTVTDQWQAVESGFVAYLCPADLWADDKLQEQVAFITQHRLDGAYCSSVAIDAGGARASGDLAPGQVDADQGDAEPGPWTVRGLLVRRDAILGSGLLQEEPRWAAEFEPLLFRYALKAGSVTKCLSTTFFWRQPSDTRADPGKRGIGPS